MGQKRQELSDLLEKDKSISNVVGNAVKKTGKFLYQTIRQSPDADIFLAGYIATYFVPTSETISETIRILVGFLAAKQYVWGHLSYNIAKSQLNKTSNASEKAFEKVFSPKNAGPCLYFGSRYALREYKIRMVKNPSI